MKASVQATRAVGAEFARRKFTTVLLIFLIASVVLIVLAAWLVSISAWWWLLAVPVIVLTFVGIIALIAARLVIKVVSPHMTQSQRSAVSEFVDKLERVAEHVQTPLPFILMRVVWEVLWPKEKPYVQSMLKDGTSLHSDFMALQKMFA